MSESPELTPKEKFHASLYKDPAALFKRTLARNLSYLIPSVALMVVWLITRDPAYGICGYGILLYQAIYRLVLARRGIQTTNRVLSKYEMKAQGDEAPPSQRVQRNLARSYASSFLNRTQTGCDFFYRGIHEIRGKLQTPKSELPRSRR
jgi:hypothetical protein